MRPATINQSGSPIAGLPYLVLSYWRNTLPLTEDLQTTPSKYHANQENNENNFASAIVVRLDSYTRRSSRPVSATPTVVTRKGQEVELIS
jgi:hypothetical protein